MVKKEKALTKLELEEKFLENRVTATTPPKKVITSFWTTVGTTIDKENVQTGKKRVFGEFVAREGSWRSWNEKIQMGFICNRMVIRITTWVPG